MTKHALMCITIICLIILDGCGTLTGYTTVGGDSYRLRGRNVATLGSYGFKDKGGLHSFEHHGTPETVTAYLANPGAEVINQFKEVKSSQFTGKGGATAMTAAGDTSGDAKVVLAKLGSAHVIVERIPLQTLIEKYSSSTDKFGGKNVLEHLRSDPRMRIVNAVIREVDSITMTGVNLELSGALTPSDAAAVVSSALASGMPSVHGEINYASKESRTYLGGRIVGYQMCHCIFDGEGNLIGLKVDRPIISDDLQIGWAPSQPLMERTKAEE